MVNGRCTMCAELYSSCGRCDADGCITCVDDIVKGSGEQPCRSASCETSIEKAGCKSCMSGACTGCFTDRNFTA